MSLLNYLWVGATSAGPFDRDEHTWPNHSSSSSRRQRRRPSPDISAPTTSSSPRSATSATCPAPRPTCRPPSSPSHGHASASTSTTTSSRCTSSPARRREQVAKLRNARLRGERGLPGHRRGPRRRVDRLAPRRGALASGPGHAHGVPRDHAGRHPLGHRPSPRARPPPGRRAGGATDPRPSLRLRGLAGAVAKGRQRPVRRPRAERGHADRRRARARAHALPLCQLVQRGGQLLGRGPALRRTPCRDRRTPGGDRRGLLPDRDPRLTGRGRPPRRARRPQPCRRPRRRRVQARERRRATLPAVAGGAVHHLDAPAGGGPQAAVLRAADDAGRPAPLRAGLHHLHADRLDDALRHRREGRQRPGEGPLRRGLDPTLRPAFTAAG